MANCEISGVKIKWEWSRIITRILNLNLRIGDDMECHCSSNGIFLNNKLVCEYLLMCFKLMKASRFENNIDGV